MARGLNAALFTLFVVGAVVLVNVVAARFSLRADLSADKRFQLAPQTKEALARLTNPVDIYAFVVEGSSDADRLTDLLREYRLQSSRVNVHIVDPEKEPSTAQAYGVRATGTVVVKMGNNQRKVEFYNLFTPSPDGGMEFRGEQAITRAILELSGYGGTTVYFLEGHGEGSPLDDFSELRSYLEGEGYTVKTLNLALENKVPDDARVVVIGGPRSDLVAQERQLLEQYLTRGGRLAVWLDPLPPGRSLPEIGKLLATLHVSIVPGVVVDPGRALFGDALSPVPELRWHDITSPLIQADAGVVLPGTVAVKPAAGQSSPASTAAPAGGPEVVPLLVTTDRSWAESTPTGQQWRRDPGDVPGPLDVAVAVQREEKVAPASAKAPSAAATASAAAPSPEAESTTTQPVAVVVGSSHFARNASFSFQGNRDFAANVVTWLAGQKELVTIRPSTTPIPRVLMTERQAVSIFYGTTLGLPLAVLAAGIAVWWRRRGL
ncbi:MAG: GldG family protein [Limnochordaceae bacterium]|nr:GldG family protein [Limnochordaceae bacterium]